MGRRTAHLDGQVDRGARPCVVVAGACGVQAVQQRLALQRARLARAERAGTRRQIGRWLQRRAAAPAAPQSAPAQVC